MKKKNQTTWSEYKVFSVCVGPLSSILSTKYSYKTVTLIGGAFAASGMMLSYFANSVTYLYIRYGSSLRPMLSLITLLIQHKYNNNNNTGSTTLNLIKRKKI